MNVITRGLFLATLVFSPMVLSSDLMNYCLESSEVLNCDMMCSQNENFVPVFPKPNGDCPKNPSPKWLDFNNPITLDQICELETEMIDTTDANGRPLGPQACQRRTNKSKMCGFCMNLNSGAKSVGPFDVECTGYNGPFQPKKLETFCPAYNTPFCT